MWQQLGCSSITQKDTTEHLAPVVLCEKAKRHMTRMTRRPCAMSGSNHVESIQHSIWKPAHDILWVYREHTFVITRHAVLNPFWEKF